MLQHSPSRRELLKLLAAAAGASVLAGVPNRWETPLVEIGTLPAHAQGSPHAGAQFQITLLHHLTACENNGNHDIFVLVLDPDGNGIPHVWVELSWDNGAFTDVTGNKIENIPFLGVNAQTTAGFVVLPVYRASVRVRVVSGPSDQTPWLREDLPDETCEANGNPQGNSLFHHSYLADFVKRW